MKKITKITSAAAVALMMVLTNGCKKEEMAPPSGSSALSAQKVVPSPGDHDVTRPASVSLRMFGSNPGRFAALDFTIMNVSLHVVSNKGMLALSKWINLPQTPRLINILDFHALSANVLAHLNVPDGIITEIKIDFAKRGIVKWSENGTAHALKAPFVPGSVIIPTHVALKHGTVANIMLAFDVESTVNFEEGNTVYLAPVIKTHNLVVGKEAETGEPVSGELNDPLTE